MGYIDKLLAAQGGAVRPFPWQLVAMEEPALVALAEELVAHGLLGTAVAAELRERGWVDGDAAEGALAAEVHRRLVNRRRAVGPYAPHVKVPVGAVDPTTPEGRDALAAHLERDALGATPDASAAPATPACAACGTTAPPALETHHDVAVARPLPAPPAPAEFTPLCPACHAAAHGHTPPLTARELRALRARG